MAIPSGSHVGRYEILGPLGAGGMGEVYRARDPRLDREVAIKVLPASFATDSDRLRRFEQEARAAGGLNHPGILSVFDIDTHDGAPFLVSELLEGETLRSRLTGTALAPRRAIEYALQIAQGLAAAHEKGIVHRDLKPDNLFVTNDGRVKILDFGLAKLTKPEGDAGSQNDSPTRTAGTDAGTVLGTAGYMSPEQVRGKPSDHRSDIFSFGAILYEMLSGRRAFHGDTAADTMTAILKEDPPELSAIPGGIAPGLERIVRHCLEKNPEGRFQSARDLAFDLEALSAGSGNQSAGTALGAARSRRVAMLAAISLAALALGVGLFLIGRRSARTVDTDTAPRIPTFKRVTFGRGNVLTARFAPGSKNVVYAAAWEGRPPEIFLTLGDAAESRSLGLPPGDVLSVSSSGELAVLLAKDIASATSGSGTLARVSLGGGAPRNILEGVSFADWSPDGQSLAVARNGGRGQLIEFPVGTPIYNTTASINGFRVSPRGDQIALLEQQMPSFDFSYSLPNAVVVVDRSGKRTEVASWVGGTNYLAWSPSGDELWFPASEEGRDGYLVAATLSGKKRVLLQVPGTLTIHDVAPDGRVLLEQDIWQAGAIAFAAGATRERDLSWLDQSQVADLSADGRF
ncbi:MAG: protein kinase, partial [Vicinamibacteria bacterium]